MCKLALGLFRCGLNPFTSVVGSSPPQLLAPSQSWRPRRRRSLCLPRRAARFSAGRARCLGPGGTEPLKRGRLALVRQRWVLAIRTYCAAVDLAQLGVVRPALADAKCGRAVGAASTVGRQLAKMGQALPPGLGVFKMQSPRRTAVWPHFRSVPMARRVTRAGRSSACAPRRGTAGCRACSSILHLLAVLVLLQPQAIPDAVVLILRAVPDEVHLLPVPLGGGSSIMSQ